MAGVRHVLMAIVVAVAALAALGACSSASSGTRSGPATSRPSSRSVPGESVGASVFRTRCAVCHGPRGEGNLGPPLVDLAPRLPVQDELAVVRDGKGRMPGWRGVLTSGQIAAVVDYVRTDLR